MLRFFQPLSILSLSKVTIIVVRSFQSSRICVCLTFTFRITIGFWNLRCHRKMFKQSLHTNCSMKCVNKKWRSMRDKWLPTRSNQMKKHRNTQGSEEKPKTSANLEFYRVWVNENFLKIKWRKLMKMLMIYWKFECIL